LSDHADIILRLEKAEAKLRQMDELAQKVEARATAMNAILDLLQVDPHQWSARGCQTCRAVSALAGRPFGCLTKGK